MEGDIHKHDHSVHHSAESKKRLADMAAQAQEDMKATTPATAEARAQATAQQSAGGSEGQATAMGTPASQVVRGEHKD
jgi:hypothetical protein